MIVFGAAVATLLCNFLCSLNVNYGDTSTETQAMISAVKRAAKYLSRCDGRNVSFERESDAGKTSLRFSRACSATAMYRINQERMKISIAVPPIQHWEDIPYSSASEWSDRAVKLSQLSTGLLDPPPACIAAKYGA